MWTLHSSDRPGHLQRVTGGCQPLCSIVWRERVKWRCCCGAFLVSPFSYKNTCSCNMYCYSWQTKGEKKQWCCYSVGGIFLAWFGSSCPLRGSYSDWSITFILWWSISMLMRMVSSTMMMMMPPFTGHEGLLNSLWSMKLM